WGAPSSARDGGGVRRLLRWMLTRRPPQRLSPPAAAPPRRDEADQLLWRFPRHRLEGEVIRDASLSVAGLLNSKMGGPSVFPELPAGMPTPRGGWKVNDDPAERNRRSVYVFVRRNTRYPLFDSFDMPDPPDSCSRRNGTTSPLQALTLLNSRLSVAWAQAFAERVFASAGPDETRQVQQAFRLAYGRLPDDTERQIAREFFAGHRKALLERSHALETTPRSV